MYRTGKWSYERCKSRQMFACKANSVIVRGTRSKLVEFKREQINFSTFHVVYKLAAANQDVLNSWTQNRRITGFSLDWYLKEMNGSRLSAKDFPAREIWTVSSPTPMFEEENRWLKEMTKVAMVLRKHNMTEDQSIERAILGRVERIKTASANKRACAKQRRDIIVSELFETELDANKVTGEPETKDFEVGFRMSTIILYCPISMIRLYHSVEQLVGSESAATLIQTVVGLIDGNEVEDTAILQKMGQFYLVLEKMFNLQFGKLLLALSTKKELQIMLDKKLPFFSNFENEVKMCLENISCAKLDDLIETLGKYAICQGGRYKNK